MWVRVLGTMKQSLCNNLDTWCVCVRVRACVRVHVCRVCVRACVCVCETEMKFDSLWVLQQVKVKPDV